MCARCDDGLAERICFLGFPSLPSEGTRTGAFRSSSLPTPGVSALAMVSMPIDCVSGVSTAMIPVLISIKPASRIDREPRDRVREHSIFTIRFERACGPRIQLTVATVDGRSETLLNSNFGAGDIEPGEPRGCRSKR